MAVDVVDLTARQAWRESAESGRLDGYFDSNGENAFGYGEWASRGGYGALLNWAVANSLLPIDASLVEVEGEDGRRTDSSYADTGLKRIDRGNTDELIDLCDQAAAIVRAVDRIDCGLNPLGLSDHAIPFDIAPKGVADGSNTHYEQVRDRAKTALANARAVLDRAQVQSNRLRMIQETAENYANAITSEEEDLEAQLVGYYGTPYTGDIGPGKTYAQGYEGPDVLHYLYMDLTQYGLSDSDITDFVATKKKLSGAELAKITNYVEIDGYITNNETNSASCYEIPVNLSRLGLVCKPSAVTGYRVLPGTIQAKYAEVLLQLAAVKAAEGKCTKARNAFSVATANTKIGMAFREGVVAAKEARRIFKYVSAEYKSNLEDLIDELTSYVVDATNFVEETKIAVPTTFGVGLTSITSPRSIVEAIALNAVNANGKKYQDQIASAKKSLKVWDGLASAMDAAVDNADEAYSAFKTYWSEFDTLKSAASEVVTAYQNYKIEATKLNALVDTAAAEISKAETLLTKRENLRKRQVDQFSQMRYNEMLFRKIRDKSLTRYQAAFDLAQKYVYMAAQVYDYETGLKREKDGSGDAFKAKIVATRALGAFSSDGEPIVADDGDLGLSGYLAQMDANWLVLKPRLGINNPQGYTTWFSLRKELFRIYGTEAGDRKWSEELGKYWVEDIRETDVYRRQCQAFQSQFGLKDKEPGLVIPFSTTIDFAKNFFGQDLAGGDHGYDSTWYSTRIAAAGVWFDGYNERTADAAATAHDQLSATPTVYLIPTGNDCLRVPGQEDGTYTSYSVVDQVIPAPYDIGSYNLDDDSWYPSFNDADWGDASPTIKIRKHPMFRAYYGPEGAQPGDDRLDATRLVGRSVWNDQWYLIIPAGSLNADRDLALSVFVNGLDMNRDGKRDLKPVSDIKIGFRTYSQSGN